MSISFVGKSASMASGTGTVTPAIPASATTGDLMLLFIESENQDASLATANGWVNVLSQLGTGTAATDTSTRLEVFWKFHTGSETAPIVADSGDHTTAIITAWRGVSDVTPFDVTYAAAINTAAVATISMPTLTTVTAGAMIINALSLNQDTGSTAQATGWTNTSLASITELHDQTVNSGGGGGFAMAYGIKTAAGAVSATTVTLVATEYSQAHSTITIALRPILLPSVTTLAATNITETTAQLNGNLTNLGGDASVNASFNYGLTDTYGLSSSTIALTVTGNFSISISGLSPGTTYHFAAEIINGAGFGNGADLTFTTTAPVGIPMQFNIDNTIIKSLKAQANIDGVIVNLTKGQVNIDGVIKTVWLAG